jgi:hypothetical protein
MLSCGCNTMQQGATIFFAWTQAGAQPLGWEEFAAQPVARPLVPVACNVPLAAPQGAAPRRNIFSSTHGASTHPMVTRGLVQEWMEEDATDCGATTT